MLDTVRRALVRPLNRRTRYECRDCGTTVRHANAECPACESTDIASYDL